MFVSVSPTLYYDGHTLYHTMCYKKNKPLFFDVMKSGQIFPSKVCHFQYDNRLLFSKEMGNIRSWKEVRLQKLITFRLSE